MVDETGGEWSISVVEKMLNGKANSLPSPNLASFVGNFKQHSLNYLSASRVNEITVFNR